MICGEALSITSLIKIPIKFLGNGETIGNLNIFYPDRIDNQILGLGNLKTLSEKIDEKIDKNSVKKSFIRILAGKFDLEDLMVQMQQIKKIGSIGGIWKFLPILVIKLIIKLKISKKKLRNGVFYYLNDTKRKQISTSYKKVNYKKKKNHWWFWL